MESDTPTAEQRAKEIYDDVSSMTMRCRDEVVAAIRAAEQAAALAERERIAVYFEQVSLAGTDFSWTAREIAAAVRDGWDWVPNAQPALR